MRIAITGVAGFIGSHLADRLLRDGHQVLGIDSFAPYYGRDVKERNVRAALAAGLELHELDLARDPLEKAAEFAQVVFHAAAQPGISASTPFEDYLHNNVIASARLVQALRGRPQLRLLVNVATSSIYGADATGRETCEPRPTSYYGVTKLAAEQLALAAQREGQLRACSLRLFSVYGPRERPEKLFPRLIRALAQDRPFPLYEGAEQHTRSFTYVDDVVGGLVACIGREARLDGEIVNLGSDIQTSTGEAIRTVERLMGRRTRREPQPRRPGDQQATHAHIEKARRLLGYEPRTAPEQGLRATVDWFTAPGAA